MSGTEQADGRDNADGGARRVIDTSVAHSARVHDYWLGGKDNFAADRAAGDAVIRAYPGIVASVRANRASSPGVTPPVRRGRDPAVPRHRDRHPGREQHPRGGAVRGARLPRRLRGLRPLQVGLCALVHGQA